MTGVHWIEESGVLSSPIALTNTAQLGVVRDALGSYGQEHDHTRMFSLPVAAETYDGWLNDIDAPHVTQTHVYQAIAAAKTGAVVEGNIGGGTGMICHDFKGGIGTASRVVENKSGCYTVGVLVQTNYGDRRRLRVDGVPVGREIDENRTPTPGKERRAADGSIIIIVATDAPLIPRSANA
jgi:D-aminopeptidase